MSQFQNAPFCPISASGSNFNPRNTLCIPVVKIFAFLDLEQISADFGLKPFETDSNIHKYTQEGNQNEESKKSVKNSTKKTGDTFKAAVKKTTGNSVKVSCWISCKQQKRLQRKNRL